MEVQPTRRSVMKNNEESYWKGYAEGQEDSNHVKSAWDIVIESVVPGTLPSEKGEAYESGYNAGRKAGKD